MSVFDPPEIPGYRSENVFSDWGAFHDQHSAQDGGRVAHFILYEHPDPTTPRTRWHHTHPVVGFPGWWP